MSSHRPPKTTILAAWVIILVASALPRVILQEIFHLTVSEDLRTTISVGAILIGLLLTLVWQQLRTLRPFLGLFLVLTGVEWLVFTRIDQLPIFQSWLKDPSFNVYMLAEKSLSLIVTLVIIAALFILKKQRQAFFLAKGDTSAKVEPVRWLGVKEGVTWNKFGGYLALFISMGTLAFLVIAGQPPLDIVVQALPFLPAVLLAAALNAFNEEMSWKASFLSVLENPVGRRQALWMVAAYFGIAHYYGVPYGVIGVLLAGFLGWLLAKSMQETHGLFWAWFIHFLQDVLIFSFLAIGSITPGGG